MTVPGAFYYTEDVQIPFFLEFSSRFSDSTLGDTTSRRFLNRTLPDVVVYKGRRPRGRAPEVWTESHGRTSEVLVVDGVGDIKNKVIF